VGGGVFATGGVVVVVTRATRTTGGLGGWASCSVLILT
jgi:hypothetical protein